MSHMIAPTRVLELGTFTGIRHGMLGRRTGPERHGRHRGRQRRTPLRSKTSIGNALGCRPHPSPHRKGHGHPRKRGAFEDDARPLDVVFVDADKEHQQAYVDWAIDHVRDGGWIVVDNVLWWGEVLARAGRHVRRPVRRSDSRTQRAHERPSGPGQRVVAPSGWPSRRAAQATRISRDGSGEDVRHGVRGFLQQDGAAHLQP